MIVFKCVFYCIRYSIYLSLSSSFNKFMLVYIAKSVRSVINLNIIFYKTNIFKQYITGCLFASHDKTLSRNIHAIQGFLINWFLHLFTLNQVAEQFGIWESSCVCVCVCMHWNGWVSERFCVCLCVCSWHKNLNNRKKVQWNSVCAWSWESDS